MNRMAKTVQKEAMAKNKIQIFVKMVNIIILM